jgi:PEP-CTERM motif-containing protein
VGTETLTNASYFFDNAINVFGITYTVNTAFLAAEDSSFATYNMQTAFGPTTYSIYSGSTVSSQPTSGGSLSVTFNGDETVTAQAVVGSSSSVPEPGSLSLALLGAIPLAAGLLRWRKN